MIKYYVLQTSSHTVYYSNSWMEKCVDVRKSFIARLGKYELLLWNNWNTRWIWLLTSLTNRTWEDDEHCGISSVHLVSFVTSCDWECTHSQKWSDPWAMFWKKNQKDLLKRYARTYMIDKWIEFFICSST